MDKFCEDLKNYGWRYHGLDGFCEVSKGSGAEYYADISHHLETKRLHLTTANETNEYLASGYIVG